MVECVGEEGIRRLYNGISGVAGSIAVHERRLNPPTETRQLYDRCDNRRCYRFGFRVAQHEDHGLQTFDRYSHFTDDTVMTVAVADALLRMSASPEGRLKDSQKKKIYAAKLKEYGRRYPDAGYGSMFEKWLSADSSRPYKSFGNGSAMRVSPIGFAFRTLEETLVEAKRSAAVTHNHKEGIRVAMTVAAAIYLARNGEAKPAIKARVETLFGYDLDQRLAEIRPDYAFDASCAGSVPQAIIAFLESDDFEDAIRKAISIGGDSDTIACMTGGIAQAYYQKIPAQLISKTNLLLDYGLKQVIREFNRVYEVRVNEG